MLYNCLFMILPTTALFLLTEDVFKIIGKKDSNYVKLGLLL